MSKTYTARPIQALGAAAALWLLINVAGDALNVVCAAIDLWVIGQLPADTHIGFFDEIPDPSGLSQIAGIARLPIILIYLITTFVTLKWFYRASRNAHSLASGLETSPPWAVGWFFVPFANFWMPYKSLSQVWRASEDPTAWRRRNAPGSMPIWWAFWLASNITGNLSFQLARRVTTAEGLYMATVMELLGAVAGIGSALLLRGIILRLSAIQTDRAHTHVF